MSDHVPTRNTAARAALDKFAAAVALSLGALPTRRAAAGTWKFPSVSGG